MSEEIKPTLQEKFLSKIEEIGCKNMSLAKNFFVAIDNAIKKSEEDRLSNDWKTKNNPPFRWSGINFEDVLQSSIAYSNIGIDPLSDDMISFVFFKNKTATGYNITFVEGVSCMEILARKYGVNCPENVKAELVYSTDVFEPIKKDINNPEDTIIHKVLNAFDRGDIIGGYTLSQFSNSKHNQLRVMSLKDINKRTKESTDFFKKWPEEMCIKTLKKNAWSKVVLNTVDLAEYHAAKKEPEFIPEATEDLPFLPENEL